MARKILMTISLCATALAACGGGGSDGNVPAATSEVPASASASTAGWTGYMMRLLATAPDDLEPVDVSAVNPPVDDSAEPTAVK
jgi:hypothetical protein